MASSHLRVVIIKPSKYGKDGCVERFRRGLMPNSTVPYLRSMTPDRLDGTVIETFAVDEYVQTNLDYLQLLRRGRHPTLLAFVGVQSNQFQRSLDLAAYARDNGIEHCVIGGPHAMTCDTSMLHNRGVSFALAEAELIWLPILQDAIRGQLASVYGDAQRWQQTLDAPVLVPPPAHDLRRYIVPMIGIYPARGCPFTCSFCSVIKIAGRQIRSQSVDTTIASLHAAKAAGVRLVMFTSDNFNKYSEAPELLERMIEEKIGLPFFVQCDAQIAGQEQFVELLGRAKCFQILVGVEAFSRKSLLGVRKAQNHPELYGEIVKLSRKYGITTHFTNIIGFPGDTATTIREHVEMLRAIGPDIVAFNILTPIPGTQQYEEFRNAGWITETNLDRFDATSSTWRHDNLERSELEALLLSCYRRFYSFQQIFSTTWDCLYPGGNSPGLVAGFAYPVFSRFAVWQGMHPMSGGVGRVRVDHARDYAVMRRSRYGYDQVPLPKNLPLSARDEELNRTAKLAL